MLHHSINKLQAKPASLQPFYFALIIKIVYVFLYNSMFSFKRLSIWWWNKDAVINALLHLATHTTCAALSPQVRGVFCWPWSVTLWFKWYSTNWSYCQNPKYQLIVYISVKLNEGLNYDTSFILPVEVVKKVPCISSHITRSNHKDFFINFIADNFTQRRTIHFHFTCIYCSWYNGHLISNIPASPAPQQFSIPLDNRRQPA